MANFEQALTQVYGQSVRVEFKLAEAEAAPAEAAAARPSVSPHQRLLEAANHPRSAAAGTRLALTAGRGRIGVEERQTIMFKGLGNFASFLTQAQQVSGKFEKLSDELKARRAVGTAGGRLVEVEINGLLQVSRCKIDPQLVVRGDRELIEDLVVAAMNQAVEKARMMHATALQEMTGGLSFPGLCEAIEKLTGASPGGPAGPTGPENG